MGSFHTVVFACALSLTEVDLGFCVFLLSKLERKGKKRGERNSAEPPGNSAVPNAKHAELPVK